jgi:mannitol-1-phosphate/altronate dehydrogenase
MGRSITKVIEIIAPIALKALAESAEALISGGALDENVLARFRDQSDADFGSTIYNDTSAYISTKFANTYGYYYQGLRSKPETGTLPVAAGMDIVVYDPGKGISNINDYLQTVLQDSISTSDSIELAQNLSQLFQERFKEESLEWTPFNKRYNYPDETIVDMYMVTSAARDVNNNLAGIATYCFVAYPSK